MTVQTDNYGIGASGTSSQKFTLTAPNDGTLKIGRGTLGAESSFPIVINSDDSVSGVFLGLGVNQTWQNVTGSRVAATTYTNSTGKPIVFMVSSTNAVSATVTLTVNGGNLPQSYILNQGIAHVSAIVPNGATYSAAGNPLIGVWWELR